MRKRILILGGYGTFGRRIVRELAGHQDLELIVAGRSIESASRFVAELRRENTRARLTAAMLDINAPDLQSSLASLNPGLVIHTCGPFTDLEYRVARSCIRTGVHYLDLADNRRFVCGFDSLNEEAKASGVLCISGASTVPAVSSGVIDALSPQFAALHAIDYGISPGNRTPRGLATIRSILGYCGKPFAVWQDGQWRQAHGWQHLTRHPYPGPMGSRWLSACDIPDLELFPRRYPGVNSVMFRAGLELSVLHLGTWLASWFSRFGLVDNWANHAGPLKRVADWMEPLGSDTGGMHVRLEGTGGDGQALTRTWYAIAEQGDGPQIPCTPAVVIAGKMMSNRLEERGAFACTGFMTLEEFQNALSGFSIRFQTN